MVKKINNNYIKNKLNINNRKTSKNFVKTFLKSNYEFILCLLLLCLILIVAINPKNYIAATFNGFSIWARIVLPSLFCFFIFTKLLMQNKATIKVFNFLNKPFEKLFNTSKVGGYVFCMSCISGYPVGAKLISEFFEQKFITRDEAFRMSCYSSTSGPMFIIGSVGVSMFYNFKLGVVVLFCHLISSLINGLLFRNFSYEKGFSIKKLFKFSTSKTNSSQISLKENETEEASIIKNSNNKKLAEQEVFKYNPTKQSLNDIMYNTIISVVMVGGYIAICFAILEVLNFLNILNFLGDTLNFILPKNAQVGNSIFKGILELTNGCVSLSNSNINAKVACIALSFLTSFGGFSIHLQSLLFLNKCGIKYKHFLLSKIMHSTIAVILSLIFSAILL